MIELDAERRVLRVHGQEVEIGDRAFDVFMVLAEHPGQVVTKKVLLAKAWPGRTVEENNLTVQISALRSALGAGVIKTVTRRGYLYVPQAVQAAQATTEAAPSAHVGRGMPSLMQTSTALSGWAGPIAWLRTQDGEAIAKAPLPGVPHKAMPARPAQRLGRIPRRLVAVAQADVAGWGRWLARDHEQAKATWHEAVQTLISPSVEGCNGQAMHFSPERMLFSFSSAVRALEWALELQTQLAQWRNDSDANDNGASIFHLRIGISVDDMVDDAGTLVGDGLAVVAGLQQLARHDDVLVTDNLRALVQPHMPEGCAWKFHGERTFGALAAQDKTPVPVGIWQASLGAGRSREAAAEPTQSWVSPQASLAHACSVAVLPFLGAKGQAELHFGPGITSNIITALSANRALFVTAHGTTLQYLGNVAEPSRVAAELGVRYLVSGWVRCVGQRLRIGVWLMDASTAQVLWRENYDGAMEDVFAFQESIALNVAAAVDPHIKEAEMVRVRSKPTSSFSAYDCLLRAQWGLYRFDTSEFEAAGKWLELAIEQDSSFAQAHANLAWWLSLRMGQRHMPDTPALREKALSLAKKALALAPQDAWNITVLGHLTALFERRLDEASALFDQALELNPSLAIAWARSGVTLAYLGRGKEALQRVQKAMALSPLDPEAFTFYTANGLASLVAGKPEQAAAWLEQALKLNPGYTASLYYLAAALVMAGQLDQAKAQAQQLLQLAPQFTLRSFYEWTPVCEPHRGQMMQALRSAGIPE